MWGQPVVVGESRQVSIALRARGDDVVEFEIYSRDASEEVIHCQGRAVSSHQPAPAPLDLKQLEQEMGEGGRGSGQLLAHLRLPAALAASAGDYVLHPSLIDSALQAGVALADGEPRLPFGMEALRSMAPCTPEMVAWVRYAPGSDATDKVVELDVDLCDAQGNVAVQMRGVSFRPVSLETVDAVAQIAQPAAFVSAPRKELEFIPRREAGRVRVEQKKRGGISLSAPGGAASAGLAQPAAGRPPITLSSAAPPVVPSAASSVRLYDEGNGVLSIQIGASTKDAIGDLRQALDRAQEEASIKVLSISGLERAFPRGGRNEYNEAVEQDLYQALVAFPCPVITVVQGDAIGGGFMAAALCDFMVCNEDASYGYTDAERQFYPTTAEASLFSERFGSVLAQDLLYGSTVSTGRQLQAKGWTCPILPAAEVEAYARELGSTLAAKSQDALRLLKQHLTRHVAGLVTGLTRVESVGEDASGTAGKTIASPASDILLANPAEHVLVVMLNSTEAKDLVANLGQIFAGIAQGGYYRAVVLASNGAGFLPDALPEDILSGVQRLLTESEVPVVAALTGDARGDAWLLTQFCDVSVYSRQGTYSARGAVRTAAAVFTHRFGTEAGKEILLTGANYTGAELQQRVGALTVVEPDDVLRTAVDLAASWARLPRTDLAAWKQQTATTLTEKLRSLPETDGREPHDGHHDLPAAPTRIALRSNVVTATAHPDGVVVVKMEDREAKNMFSEAFVEGLQEAFTHIDRTPAYKVVILTGYDSYFASGGTKESLLAIQQGDIKFTDFKIFQLPLDCRLPVIAAMQGHGIGAGWCLGMFADLVLLSEESRYVSPYMNYGFTPGAGATYILPETLGSDLAREGLLTAQPYDGRDLKRRRATLRVLPRAEVEPAAMALARQLAQASRGRLIGLKQQLTQHVRKPLEETYARELAMHALTFVGQSGTLAQIEKNFHQQVDPSPVAQHPRIEAPSAQNALPAVTAGLKTLLATELQMRESDIDDDAQFVDLGLDSIAGVTWIRKINEKYGTALEATKVYSYPTLAQLGRYVKEEADKLAPPLSTPDAAPVVTAAIVTPVRSKPATMFAAEKLTSWRGQTNSRITSVSTPDATHAIAVIGMAGQFPQAKNVEEFWQNIADGRNCITPVPRERWDLDGYYQPGSPVAGKTNSQWVGALDQYDLFDPLFFNISPAEAESMDPQQRLFLQACWQSIEDAGYDARVLSGSKCGVFVGCATSDYHLLSREQQLSAQSFTGEATSILAARISYFLNLQGPCLSIDTACSSSLVAIAQACDSLSSGASDAALAGGVYVMAGPEMHIRTSQVGMLSPQGQCFTFDQRADGIVPGEAVGVVMLKRLADAERDGDIIHGVIQGWGVNQDGKTNGITAPNPESQTRLERYVYDKYRINPADIQLIEAHGTGTKLGDPIEVEGLKQAFSPYTQDQAYCALGSVKSNIGHCMTAAGIAGVIKLLLALKHKQQPPTINFERLNEHIKLDGSPFYVNSRLQEWSVRGAQQPRLAAISSFGFSGTNAHIVIGEAPAAVQRPASVISSNSSVIVPLSARTPEQLQQKADDLLTFLRKDGPSIELAEVAYTLQVGRTAMDERLGFVVSSVEQLTERLEAYVSGTPEMRDFYRGQVRRGNESLSIISQNEDVRKALVDNWTANGKLANLLELWVKGLELDWTRLHGETNPRRVSLPVYPFAKERYWVDTAASNQAADGRGLSAPAIHPLLHSNTSDLSQQSYSATFSGEEFFLSDHRVRADGGAVHKVLPGAAYLEMARAAIADASPARDAATVLELRDIVWVQPIVVSDNTQVSIALAADDHDEIEYEIYSEHAGEEIVHCQGRAISSREPAPAPLDLERLRAQLGPLESSSVYPVFADMGLLYGPAFQGITAIARGSDQALAQLRLPASVVATSGDYVLHPSLIDSALQACVGLLDGSSVRSTEPRLPFALDSLRILASCTEEMLAWVRYAPGSQAADPVVKLDIDLCDEHGNIAVQLKGFSLRALSKEIGTAAVQAERTGSLLASPIWHACDIDAATASSAESTEQHIVLCELSNVVAEELESLLPRSRCLSLDAGRQQSIAQRYSEYALACFERIATILQHKPEGKVLVQILVPAHQEQTLFAGLSGMLKTAALENPHFAGQLLLVTPQMNTRDLAARLRQEIRATDTFIRYDGGARQVLRWKELPADGEPATLAFRDDGVYLITGGLGALGLLIAREILGQTAQATVVLTGRSALTPENQARLDGLLAQPGRVRYRRVDVSDLDPVRHLIASIEDDYGQLNGIVHIAGMTADNFILKKTLGEFSEVLAPKVTGTFNLDEASRDVQLDFFVLFSSIAGALGNLGQADYAAANAFMDQFAAYRNRQVAAKQRHGLTRSINWPLWQAGAMSLDPARQELVRRTTGLQPMQTATGMAAFHRSLTLPYDQLLVTEGELAQIRRVLFAGPPVAAELPAKQPVVATEGVSASLAEKAEEYLRQQLSGVLKLPAHKIDPQAALETYGIDSILALKLTDQLEQTFGTLSKTLFFEYQTIRELTQYFLKSHAARLVALLAPGDAKPQAGPLDAQPHTLKAIESKPVSNRRFKRQRIAASSAPAEADPIAIIGLSGRYPEAADLEMYWQNLRDGKDCITEVPKERWNWQTYFTDDRTQGGYHYSKWGGFIEGVAEFDPLFFNISPKEAKFIDPQERLFLQHAWMAVEDAGYTRAGLQVPHAQDLPGQVGVYVGVMYTEYQLFGADATAQGTRLGVPGSAASISNRVSYVLNLHGPSVTLDTMCSSSLTAIHFACEDLKRGRTSMAIAGGVNVSIHPNKYLVLSAGQFISSDGHCQSFGEGGDGYIPGEGVGAVILKRLSEAERDGDHIYGVIRGSALNHGGKTNGYTVPSPQAQTSAIGLALAESHTDARHISYIEAHGTGTKLGDPIEITALSRAFQPYTEDTGFCLIGSAKSNIGHCESAAGIAGLTKVLLQMQHQQIVPSLHSTHLNPHIDFPNTPFIVNQTLRPWEQPVIDGRKLPRIAGISSFGAGGSNAHLIVEEYRAPVQQPVASGEVVILLSARTGEALRQKAEDLLHFIRPRRDAIDLAALAYTLQTGREAMDERLGFLVSSAEQLVEKLQAYVAGEQGIENAYEGQVKRDKQALSLFSTDTDLQETIDKWIAGRKLAKLLELWVKGLQLDWSQLHGATRPRRISAPTYPFARERYWIDEIAAPAQAAAKGAVTAVLHPLLHSNTSDLTEQRYRSTFTGEEPFLKDYQTGAPSTIPASAYLEMARAAIEQVSPAQTQWAAIELRDVAWAQPAITPDESITTALLATENGRIEFEIYSERSGEEIVHCQGSAAWSSEAAPASVDLARLEAQMGAGRVEPQSIYAACARSGLVYGPSYHSIVEVARGRDQVLARLRLPERVEGASSDYVLHPAMMEGALQACAVLLDGASGQSRLPLALGSLRIVSPSSKEMAAWVRYSPGSETADAIVELDIDLYDAQGRVCAEMRGVSWQPAAVEVAGAAAEVAAAPDVRPALAVIPQKTAARREIVLAPFAEAAPSKVTQKRPGAISLAAPSGQVLQQPSTSRVPITLSGAPGATAAAAVRLFDEGDGIFAIRIDAAPKDVIAQLRQALDLAQQETALKVMMLSGLDRGLARGGRAAYNDAVEQKLYHAILSFPSPVIAVLQGDTIGAGFMAAALCDFMVCNEAATFGYTDADTGLHPAPSEAILLGERFGDLLAQDLLYVSLASTGRQLRAKGWTCPIVPSALVDTAARELATTLATKSQEALRLLKQHLTRQLGGLVDGLTRIEAAADAPSRADAKAIAPVPHLQLDTPVERVLVITLGGAPVTDLVSDLGQVFAELRQSDYRAIVLASDDPELLPGPISEEVVSDFQRLMAEIEIPVVAALTGNAKGNAWAIAQLCDAAVYSRHGVYSSGNAGQTAAAIFTHRFGNDAGGEFLLTGRDYSGAELQRRAGFVTVAEESDVLQAAVDMATSWTTLSLDALASWKRHNASILQEKTRRLAVGWADEAAETQPDASPIRLRSKVVTATAHPGGIVVVKMEDREAKNMFSDAFIEGVAEAFAHIEQSAAYKVVVLTGYEHYFASGGTKESLLAIQAGKIKFTDSRIFQLPLDCKLPVIAAMQGHGIGAGWCLGMFADLVLLSEESRYVSPYMDYGFTPGAGATWILPEKLGPDLARESLLTAQPHTGSTLKARGLLLPVLPRSEVFQAAMTLAGQIARTSRHRLIAFKRQLTVGVREALEETYRLELAMHDQTFVGRSDTLAQIQTNFHQEPEPAPVAPPQRRTEPARRSAEGETLSAITATLRTLLANELQMRESDIDDNTQFIDLGLDSIAGVTWLRKINEKYQTTIEATKVYSYPTLAQLSRHVKEEADQLATASSVETTPAADVVEVPIAAAESTPPPRRIAIVPAAKQLTSRRSRTASRFVASAPAPAPALSQPIAIVGMAGQFPRANNIEEFWQNLAEGRNCITEIPRERWNLDTYYQAGEPVEGKSYSQWSGAVEEYDLFDPLFFNISPTEAENMDPQQRLFLQACWHSIEHAGYDARVLSGSRCGVFVGCATGDYHQASRAHQLSALGFTGSATSILAARISYFLNLQGPCVSIDTACSSSLVAIAQACDSLTTGVSDLALAGGVYVMGGPEMHIRTSQAGMLSPEGRCFSFDQRADGFVPGEGVGVVVMKRLADAQRDGDIVYGVIEGWGVNQDGRTNGITAPNPESQTRLEQEVYDRYRLDPTNIQLIEAHGTGTKLGDPIEIEGLKDAFSKYTQNKEYCALGSVKSNIGHCLTAAGIAGVIKLLLALKHKQLPPTINFDHLNEHIDLTDSPFYVNTQLQEWELKGAPRRQAAISSFGFSGTNAHLVIGEYVLAAAARPPVTVVTQNAKVIVPLSARKPKQLKQKARDLLAFIRTEGPSPDLIELAYTLQVGREAMEERAGFLVSSLAELAEGLEAYLDDKADGKDVYQGQVKHGRESLSILSQDDEMREAVVAKWLAEKKLSKLLDLWTKGLSFDWNELYGETKPQRIALPVYPFAKDRYWIETSAQERIGTAASAIATAAVLHPLLHPLLHANTSDLSEHRYSSTFTGDEVFLTDHRVRTDARTAQRVLPGVAYLEMARAAIERALPMPAESAVLELHDLLWAQPIIVAESKRVSVTLSANGRDEVEYEIYSQEGEQEIVHQQGRGLWTAPPRTRLDLDQLKGQMQLGRLDASGLYDAFARMGLHYGPAHQAITAIHLGDDQLLADLRLPAGVDDGYVLHPSLMDGAFQAAIQLSGHTTPCLPSALETLRIMAGGTAEMLAWVRYSPVEGNDPRARRLDIDLLDREGNVCVEIIGLELARLDVSEMAVPERIESAKAPKQLWDRNTYLTKWEQQPELPEQRPAGHQNVVVVCCAPFSQLETTILEHYQERNCTTTLIRLADATEQTSDREWSCGIQDPEAFETCLQAAGAIDAVYFLAMGEQPADPSTAQDFAEGRESNEIQFLRLIKALQQSDIAGPKVDLYILTLDSHSSGARNGFMGAGVTGLGYSLAQGNSRYRVRNLHLSAEDLLSEPGRRATFAAIAAEPASNRGEVHQLRAGRRYRQTFFKLKWDTTSQPELRHGGTYVIVGGAGTVGRIITRNLIRKYEATVVWIGRSSEISEKVQSALASFEGAGAVPLYIQADVTDLDSMQKAVRLMKEKGVEIHGAIFAAMVFGADNTIEEITESEFRHTFDIKAQGSWSFYTALKTEPLDFMCYFSSRQAYALLGASRYAAYGSGVTFSDAFVRSVQDISPFPVGTINWGIWKSTLDEATEGMTAESLDALSDEEGFDCFELFVTELQRGRVHQCLCVGESRLLESLMNRNEEELITLAKGPVAVRASLPDGAIAVPGATIAALRSARATSGFEEWLVELLFCQIDSLIESSGLQAPATAAELASRCGIVDKYLPWWNESLNVLCQHGYLQTEDGGISTRDESNAGAIRDRWQSQKERYAHDPDTRALAELVSDCMEALPAILQGRVLATDVIFPNSSMEKVEGVYRNNTLSDTFNDIVAGAVVACVEQRLQADPKAELRIIEIGAGTGGTSAVVFAALRPFQESIERYSYTDLSQAFFFHAEEKYISDYPYIQCQRLDVEQPVEEQGFEAGSYDLVIAANVLHATKDIRQTIRNAKAVLRTDGVLLLNEVSSKSLPAHLTFGLLDGWWLFEDAGLRIPNSPALSPAQWKQVLEEEGFPAVQFPASEAHDLGYQVILAQSDGVIRQRSEAAEAPQPSAVPPPAIRPKERIQIVTPVAGSPLPNAQEHVSATILDCMCDVLKISREDVDADIAFSDYGIDSILGGKFIEQVNVRLAIRLNTAVIFEYPSQARLSRYVMETYREQIETGLVADVAPQARRVTPAPESVQKRANELYRRRPAAAYGTRDKQPLDQRETSGSEIAVIGMSGMFPKAENVDEFWSNLLAGIDGVDELPPHYLDQQGAYSARKQHGKTRCKWGGVLDERDCFDPLFFNLSPKEAEAMNPHQRLILQESWKAIEDAAFDPRTLSGTQTGIFIGAEPTGYVGESFTGYSDAIIASRLSYVLNLNGPAFVVNTGCSSSAVAIHLACESLRNRETDLALAGGANACMNQSVQIRLDEIEMLSPSGRSRTFDSAADGTIVSEGVAVVVLKRLEDAERAGDLIYGVITGSGINQDGASNGITAPSGAAQEQLVTRVYQKFGIDPETISYVEAHGTGTKLGDPVEGNALVRAFRRFTEKTGYCAVGSAKSHIGHTAAAAGVTGLIKILLSMQHSRIPGLLHFNALNPLIELDDSPFYVAADESEWLARDGAPRIAALNSFGHSGTNAHMVVREYPQAPVRQDVEQSSDPVIVPLSAKTPEQLTQKAVDLLAFIRARRPEAVDLQAMSYTLQTAREAMEERVGFIVSSVEQFAERLAAYAEGKQNIPGVRHGRAKRQRDALALLIADGDLQETLDRAIRDRKLTKLLELWVHGVELDWNRFHGDAKPRRMRLPVYPFAKERYWAYDESPVAHREQDPVLSENFESLEDVLDRIEQGLMGEDEGVQAVRLLVS